MVGRLKLRVAFVLWVLGRVRIVRFGLGAFLGNGQNCPYLRFGITLFTTVGENTRKKG